MKADKMIDEGLVLVNQEEIPMGLSSIGYTKKYQAFKHWSKHIWLGDRRIQVDENSPLDVTAFINGSNDRVVMVIVNTTNSDSSFSVSGLPNKIGLKKVMVTNEVENHKYGWLGAEDVVPAKSIMTLIYSH